MAKIQKNSHNLNTAIVLKSLEREAVPLFKQLNKLQKIENGDDYELAGKAMSSLKLVLGKAQEKENELRLPLKKLDKDIAELFKPFQTSVLEAQVRIKNEMLAYVLLQESRKLKLEEDFGSGKIKKATTFMAKTTALEVVSSFSNTVKRWTAIPINEELTPRQYMMPDVQKIKEALKAGKAVKGWEWKQLKNISI